MVEDAALSVTSRVRLGYCVAIVAIAALGFWSFFVLDKAISEQRQVNELVDVVNGQQMLSQRLVLLTNLAHHEETAIKRAVATNALREALTAFEAGHNRLKERALRYDSEYATALSDIMYNPPYDVNYFSGVLADTTDRFLNPIINIDGTRSAEPVSQMQSIAAHSALSALKDAINEYSARSQDETASLLRAIFSALMILLALETLLIFSPLTGAIKQRTYQLKIARDHMAKLANHDQVTGLNNRTAMAHQFPKIVKRHESANSKFTVIHLDLDDFKTINDTFGHAAGDAVLRETGRRLGGLIRDCDFTARIGGDEFVVILDGLQRSSALNQVLDRLMREITQIVRFDGIEINVTASAGVSVYPQDAHSDESLLVAADLALYQAKHMPGSAYVMFDPQMSEDFKRNRSLRRPRLTGAAKSAHLNERPAI